MRNKNLNKLGFTLVEVIVAAAVFVLFAVGIYSGITMVFKIVYQSRVRILETAILSEELEIARNLPYDSVGIVSGVPAGVLSHTKTLVRNGIIYNLITTVRNVDDPFDGTLGGSPNDSAPADYKLVEVSAICVDCEQKTPVSLSTIVAPKKLEGDSKNGALFIHVFDAHGQDVVGANVHIVNNSVSPHLSIDDTTDNSGMVRVIDTPTSTIGYQLTVSKSGYSFDSTITPTVANPNPLKLPSTVISQTVTNISFAIDQLGQMNVSALNATCANVSGVKFGIFGAKLLGTEPDIYKYNNQITSGASATALNNMEWDTYSIITTSTVYDVAGSIPIVPFKLEPGTTQNVFLILKPHTSNSLLVKIKDAGTGLPLADATVRLTASGYDESLSTSLGYSRQTDWSGGSGQVAFVNEAKYFSDDGNIANSSPAGDLRLRISGKTYASSGYLESSTYDLGENITLRNIVFEPLSQRAECGANPIRFQLAASSSSTPTSWTYLGPDGTASTYYTATSTVIHSGLNGKRYLRYKVFLRTSNTSYSPQLFEVYFTYTNECTPPGQVFFNGLSEGTYDIEVSKNGYSTNSGSVDVSGQSDVEINLSTL